jgi:LysR family glycine cleavage system transcriptional activator
MSRSLLPLNGLKAFEVAARHMNFTRAAAELAVTQSAVSHQIRGLEARLGLKLFRRLGASALVLTDAGQLLLPVVRDAFDRLTEGVERVVQRESAGGTLTVSVSPYFAGKWLMPRIGRFLSSHPELSLRVSASQYGVDFDREQVDAAIRHGLGLWQGLKADRLFTDPVYPVCSPALLAGAHPLDHPGALAHHLLIEDPRHGYWESWLRAVGLAELAGKRSRRLVVDDIGLVLQAAIAGQGVGMGRTSLVADDLASGRLARPFAEVIPGDNAYYFVYPEAAAERPKIAKLSAWLMEEGKEMRNAA